MKFFVPIITLFLLGSYIVCSDFSKSETFDVSDFEKVMMEFKNVEFEICEYTETENLKIEFNENTEVFKKNEKIFIIADKENTKINLYLPQKKAYECKIHLENGDYAVCVFDENDFNLKVDDVNIDISGDKDVVINSSNNNKVIVTDNKVVVDDGINDKVIVSTEDGVQIYSGDDTLFIGGSFSKKIMEEVKEALTHVKKELAENNASLLKMIINDNHTVNIED